MLLCLVCESVYAEHVYSIFQCAHLQSRAHHNTHQLISRTSSSAPQHSSTAIFTRSEQRGSARASSCRTPCEPNLDTHLYLCTMKMCVLCVFNDDSSECRQRHMIAAGDKPSVSRRVVVVVGSIASCSVRATTSRVCICVYTHAAAAVHAQTTQHAGARRDRDDDGDDDDTTNSEIVARR